MSSPQLHPSREVLVEQMRRTDGRLAGAEQMLKQAEAEHTDMSRHDRRSKAGLQKAAYVEALRGTVESLRGLMAGVRWQLGEGPEPVDCPHTTTGPTGERLPCQAGYGHGGLHVHQGTIRRRWE